MVITKLKGGLGNQMFQYAAARRLAHTLQTALKLDLSYYETDTLRTYSLQPLNITSNLARPDEPIELKKPANPRSWPYLLFRLRYKLRLHRRWTVMAEGHFRPFRPDILTATGNVYLDGFWQSEKYFIDIAEIIRREFTMKPQPDPHSQELAQMITATSSVALHIRRTDYVLDPQTNQTHGTCDLDYYYACVQGMTERVVAPHFFVFSDDPAWAMAHLRLDHPVTFVTHNGTARDYEDLRLMSLCQHQIIANSSFSWWAAWLNPNPDKIVMAPRRWFHDPSLDTRDLLPEKWLKY
jgi:hypothetical protein